MPLIGRVNAADKSDAGEIALAGEGRALRVRRGGGHGGVRAQGLKQVLRALDGRTGDDHAIAEGFTNTQTMLLAETIHHRLHDQ